MPRAGLAGGTLPIPLPDPLLGGVGDDRLSCESGPGQWVVGWEALARGPRGSELERPDLLFAASTNSSIWNGAKAA